MYKKTPDHQIAFDDFNQACGMQLDPKNEWVARADQIPWEAFEVKYAARFPSKKGHPAVPARVALGALLIQKKKQLSDRKLVKEITENPYLQYFLGQNSFRKEPLFKPTVLVEIRKRISVELLMEFNNLYLETASATKEHDKEHENPRARQAKTEDEDHDTLGTLILDATVSPSNIRYPQDFSLLNEAREKLEKMIDSFHKEYEPWKKPRTYRRVARKEYLAIAKSKKRSEKKMRAHIRRELERVRRDIGYLDDYMSEGYAPPFKNIDQFLTILKLYEQQKYMFDNHTHTVEERIVSISQPYIRPIVRGKARAKTEFGAKYDVSVDENGHARLEKVSFEPYNENTIFKDVVNRYRERTGHFPRRVLVDQIYRTRENIVYCKEHGIELSGPRLGRPPKDKKHSSKNEWQDNKDRGEVERYFSLEKRCSGGGLIMTKLEETSLSSIALSVLVTNIFATPLDHFFVLYFMDSADGQNGSFLIEFDDPV